MNRVRLLSEGGEFYLMKFAIFCHFLPSPNWCRFSIGQRMILTLIFYFSLWGVCYFCFACSLFCLCMEYILLLSVRVRVYALDLTFFSTKIDLVTKMESKLFSIFHPYLTHKWCFFFELSKILFLFVKYLWGHLGVFLKKNRCLHLLQEWRGA